MFLCSLRYCLKCYFLKGVYSFTLSTVHISSIPYITTCCPGEFQEKLSSLIPKKLQHIQLSDTTGTSNVTSFYGQMKLKKSFLAANQPDEFSTNRDLKKYPMSMFKYTAGSLMLWACFSARRPGHLVQMHGIMDSIKY